MFNQERTKNLRFNIKKFFFPFSPIKSFRSTRLLLLLAVLIGLRIVLGLLTIRIAPLGLSISIAWVPLMVIGWYFGPVIGLFIGIITDTISFLMAGGGIWFWLYAIQEPIVGFISGLIAGVYRSRKNNNQNNIVLDIIINQILIAGFAIVTYVILAKWLNSSIDFDHSHPDFDRFYRIYKWVAIIGITLLIIVYELITILTLTKKIGKNNHGTMINFIYTSSLVILIMFIFSIGLGPIIAIEYVKFIGLDIPEEYSKLGSLFYLIPRIAIEAIKVPLETSILFGIICLSENKILNIVNRINNSWEMA